MGVVCDFSRSSSSVFLCEVSLRSSRGVMELESLKGRCKLKCWYKVNNLDDDERILLDT